MIKKAVAKDREQRYHSAHTLTRALEDVTLRVEGAEDLHPYPGLASFTEEDAEYFFGREAEVEQMWRKLEGPPRTCSRWWVRQGQEDLVHQGGADAECAGRLGDRPSALPETQPPSLAGRDGVASSGRRHRGDAGAAFRGPGGGGRRSLAGAAPRQAL